MIRDADRITHMLNAISDAKESIAGMTEEQFLANKDKRVAAERYILIVGEASHMVSQELKDRHHEVPWQDIRAMRNIVAHEYMDVDYTEVWQAVSKDFDELRKLVEPIQEELAVTGAPPRSCVFSTSAH